MKHRNIYRDIVIIVLAVLLFQKTVQNAEGLWEEQKYYEYMVTAPAKLTETTLQELKKIEGVLDFYPVMSVNMVLKLEGYTMDVTVKGVDIETYPLQLSSREENLSLGNTPALFLSTDCLEQFMDINGQKPGKKKIEQWKQEYTQLSVEASKKNGERTEKIKISGILDKPEADILMEQKQMKALAERWREPAEITRGCLRIKGKTNASQAAEVLERSGFTISDNK